MNCAALIVGIDGWEQYTLPLLQSMKKYCWVQVIDNESAQPYPLMKETLRVNRMCYSAAINRAKKRIDARHHGSFDWYIVLSNDVLCTGPFAHLLAPLAPCVAGPQLWHEHGLDWIVGWCVVIPRVVWDAVGGWDEGYILSSVEDVDFSVSALGKGYSLRHMPALPFVHLDQKQRFGLPGYEGSEMHNWHHFARKHAKVTT